MPRHIAAALAAALLLAAAVPTGQATASEPTTSITAEADSANLPRANFRALNSTLNWFLENPPSTDGSNFEARWEQSKILDEYAWQLSHTQWKAYQSAWVNDPQLADAMEQQNPILYYLDRAEDRTFAEIERTQVEQGAVMWQLYNMGMVVKTKDATYGIDIRSRDSARLVDDLDFAIVSHRHGDHYDPAFVEAMRAAGKPVLAPFEGNGLTVIGEGSQFSAGEVTVRFTMNSQGNVPVAVSEADLGAGADHYTIYDISDARNWTS